MTNIKDYQGPYFLSFKPDENGVTNTMVYHPMINEHPIEDYINSKEIKVTIIEDNEVIEIGTHDFN